MNGLELSRAYYDACGKPMLEEQFPELLPFLAAGLFGSGSECFGYDDAVSRDHDFEPGFCLFLPGEDVVDRRSAFLLERAYAKLPAEFRGFRREPVSPVGGARHGVFRTGEFFERMIGAADGVLSESQWLSIPEEALAEATNGLLFFDNYGDVSRIRDAVSHFPEDIRLKRLAGHLLLMGQSGQYNYIRCLKHGEPGAAQLAAVEYAKSAISSFFLLNRCYQPYYKWAFRAFRILPKGGSLADGLEFLISSSNGERDRARKVAVIEETADAVASLLREEGLSSLPGSELERHAYAVNDRIREPSLRNLHILTAV